MWGKVCNVGCNQKTDILDKYINAYYYCRMKPVDIARLIGVSSSAVEKGLKRYDHESYKIEKVLRKRDNLEKRRTQIRENVRNFRKQRTPYYLVARRALSDPEILTLLRRAYFDGIEKYYSLQTLAVTLLRSITKSNKITTTKAIQILALINTAKEVDELAEKHMCFRYIPEAKQIIHPVPMIAQVDVEKLTPLKAKRIANYEHRIARASLAGVPGYTILDLRKALDNNDFALAYIKARQAINQAGYVSLETTTESIANNTSKIINPSELQLLKEDFTEQTLSMSKAPDKPTLSELNSTEVRKKVKSWIAQANAIEKQSTSWGNRSRNGKKGKGGGVINIEDRQKLSAVNGY